MVIGQRSSDRVELTASPRDASWTLLPRSAVDRCRKPSDCALEAAARQRALSQMQAAHGKEGAHRFEPVVDCARRGNGCRRLGKQLRAREEQQDSDRMPKLLQFPLRK